MKKVKKHRVVDDTSSADDRNRFQHFQNFKNMETDAVSSEIQLYAEWLHVKISIVHCTLICGS